MKHEESYRTAKSRLVMDETGRLVRLAQQRQANLLEGFDGVCIAKREGKPMFMACEQSAIDPVQVDALNVDGGVCPALNAQRVAKSFASPNEPPPSAHFLQDPRP